MHEEAPNVHHWHSIMAPDEFVSVQLGQYEDTQDGNEDLDLPCEPMGHGAIDTGSVQSCKELLRTFVRSSIVMD